MATPKHTPELQRRPTRSTAKEMHDELEAASREEMVRPAMSLLFSAFAGGLLMGFTLLAAGYMHHLSDPPLAGALAAAAYPLGFAFVVLGRSELFTESTIKPVIPLLEDRSSHTARLLLRFWVLLLIGNVIGAALFGVIVARTAVVTPEVAQSMLEVSRNGTTGEFGYILYRAIFAGWLIALLTWLLSSTRDTVAQLILVWLCTAPIGAFHLHHSIAGTVEAVYRAALDDMSWLDAWGGFVLPAVIGNAIGGIVLVAVLNHGQATAEK